MNLLHLATPDDLPRLLPMVAALHEGEGYGTDDAHREAALAPLLDGSPHGAVWLIGPRMAPVGYVVVTFGWSIEFGGLDGIVDEVFIRPAVRGRGMATEALNALCKALAQSGVKALHLEVDRTNADACRLYSRCKFEARDSYMLMSRVL